jgi:hypothetical protein
MSKIIRVNVIKKPPTPRDYLSPERYNAIFQVEAHIPKNSYLFIGDIEFQKEEFAKFKKNIDEVFNRIIRSRKIDYSIIQNILREYPLIKSIKQSSSTAMLLNKPYLPASSLKGAIRSRLEYKFIPKNGSSYSCYISTSLEEINELFARRHINFWGEDVKLFRYPCNIELSRDICIVCDMFGTPGLSSRIDFTNAMPVGEIKLEIKDEHGQKIQVISSNSRFKFEILCRNFNLEELGLLFTAMELYTNSPILIGRFKYRYNPKLEPSLKYYFGLLKLNLIGFSYVYPKWKYENVEELLKDTRNAIEDYISKGFLDLNKGVIP